jgi:hypothetical protein
VSGESPVSGQRALLPGRVAARFVRFGCCAHTSKPTTGRLHLLARLAVANRANEAPVDTHHHPNGYSFLPVASFLSCFVPVSSCVAAEADDPVAPSAVGPLSPFLWPLPFGTSLASVVSSDCAPRISP